MSTNTAIEIPTNPELSIDAATVTRYMEKAEEFVKALDALAAKLPRFETNIRRPRPSSARTWASR